MDKEELFGYIETLSKLYNIWSILTDLLNNKLQIFKGDWAMDRTTEMFLHEAKEYIPKMRNLIDKTIKSIKDKLINNLKIYGLS